jgi:hypothetical protein
MNTPRTCCTAVFNAKQALEMVKGQRMLNEIVSKAKARPNILIQWNKQLLESLPSVFID